MDEAKIDALFEEVMREAGVPGAGLSIVLNRKLALCKGFGLRDLDRGLTMTSGTLYPIASTSKAFTATLIGMLVDDGLLSWDVPVIEYIPSFRLGDVWTSAQVTLRDLLCMRTGLPRHDWMWQDRAMTRLQLAHGLRHLELAAGFREKFQYSNLTVTIAGHVAEVVTGREWEDLVRKRLLDPVGMTSTRLKCQADALSTQSYHPNAAGQLILSKRLDGHVTAPSGGGIESSLEDMARWMIFNLDGGSAGNRRLIEPATLQELQAPHMPARTDPCAPTPLTAYGMGWFVDRYASHRRVAHNGFIYDVNSEVMLFPDDGIGIAAFINSGGPRVARLLCEHVFDSLYDRKPQTSLQTVLAAYEAKLDAAAIRRRSIVRIENAGPSHEPKDYAGTYEHPAYGALDIFLSDRMLHIRRFSLEAKLDHLHYDSWLVRDEGDYLGEPPHSLDTASPLTFETDSRGFLAAFSMQLEAAVSPIRFEKQPS